MTITPALLGVFACRRRASFDTSYGFASSGGGWTLSNSNKTAALSTISSGTHFTNITAVALSGKTYWEVDCSAKADNAVGAALGVFRDTSTGFTNSPSAAIDLGGGFCGVSDGLYINGTFTSGASGYVYALGDRIGIAFDASTRKIWFRKNGVWNGDPAAGTGEAGTVGSGTFYPGVDIYTCGGGTRSATANLYPQSSDFTGSIPSGFSAYAP